MTVCSISSAGYSVFGHWLYVYEGYRESETASRSELSPGARLDGEGRVLGDLRECMLKERCAETEWFSHWSRAAVSRGARISVCLTECPEEGSPRGKCQCPRAGRGRAHTLHMPLPRRFLPAPALPPLAAALACLPLRPQPGYSWWKGTPVLLLLCFYTFNIFSSVSRWHRR